MQPTKAAVAERWMPQRFFCLLPHGACVVRASWKDEERVELDSFCRSCSLQEDSP